MSRATMVAASLALAVSATSLVAQGPVIRPPLMGWRVAGEVTIGAYAGIGGFMIGRSVGGGVANLLNVQDDDAHELWRNGMGLAFAEVLTTGAVYGIGNIEGQTGDLGTTALGAAGGLVVATVASHVLLGPGGRPRPGMSTSARWATVNVLAMLPAVGATIAFNATREYR